MSEACSYEGATCARVVGEGVVAAGVRQRQVASTAAVAVGAVVMVAVAAGVVRGAVGTAATSA